MSDRLEFKAAFTVDDTGAIEGTAWPFGSADSVGDWIEKGAFGPVAKLPMLFAHDQAQAIGVWDSITETPTGLQVKGRLLTESVERAREVHALVKAGAVSGLSIGFITKQAKPRQRGRTITALDLREISVVAVPAHPGATITSIKAATDGPATDKENHMENDVQNETETKAAPHIELKALNDNLGKINARVDKLEAKSNRLPIGEPANDEIEHKAFANFLQGVELHRLSEVERKALTVASDATSGFVLAPEDTTTEFIRNLVEWSPIRSLADVRSTTSHTVTIPKRLTVTNAVWTGEGAATTGSEPSFGEVSLPIREITTHVDVGNWLLEDSGAVETEVRLALAEDFGKKEAAAFANGTGALQPEGFMTNADVAQTLNGHATNLSSDALINLMYALPAIYRNRGSWVLNSTTLATIRKLKNSAGDYIWQPAYAAGQPETILGRPVLEAVEMADPAANAFPIIFGDFKSAYRIYDRLQLDVKPNPYLLATEGKVRFHARRRVGAAVVRPEALRKLKMAAA